MSHSILQRVVAVRKPRIEVVGEITQPRELGPPVLRKAGTVEHVTVKPERRAQVSNQVLTKKFKDLFN